MNPIDQSTLEKFVSGKFHWQSLAPHLQKAMAIELLKSRYLIQEQYKFMGDLLNGQDTEGDSDRPT
jgi:hypothetical protein